MNNGKTPKIIGYAFDPSDTVIYPVFSSERKGWTSKIYKTAEEAKRALFSQNQRRFK